MTNYDKPFSVLMIDPPWLKKKGGLTTLMEYEAPFFENELTLPRFLLHH